MKNKQKLFPSLSLSLCLSVSLTLSLCLSLSLSLSLSISLSFSGPGEKWYKRYLTYQIVNWPRHLSPGPVRLAVRAAFQLWSNVSGLVFRELPAGPADIRLAFYRGDHNDGASNAFDGPGGEGGPALSLRGSQVPSLLFWR